MAEEVAEKKHALLSPSGAHRWARCPGSVVLEEGMPDSSSSYARWGTCAHEVAGIILTGAVVRRYGPIEGEVGEERWDPENAEAYIGRVFQIEGHDVEFDHEMADCVNDYVAHVESFWEPGDILIVEQAVPLEQITGEKDATGTSDCIIIKPRDREIVVIDLKGGKGVMVDADENEQGLMYGGGTVHEHDLLYGPFERVRIVIIQPRLNHVSEWAIDFEEFEERIEKLKVAAKNVEDARILATVRATDQELNDAGYLNPGEKQCKFCKAKKLPCPALEGAVSDALSLTAPPAKADEFPDLSINKQAAAAVPEEPAEIDHERIAKAWKAIPLVEQWIEAIRSTAHARLHDGQPVGDLCLYEGKQGNRYWKDAEAAEQRLKKSRVKADVMYEKKLISPTAAEKLYKAGTISEAVFSDLAAFIDRPDGKPVVGVQGDPKKTPWSPVKPEDFPDLDAEEDPLFS